jgi:uncharacterized protein with NAD-binding domain and iron-sulfur cluster
MPDKPHIAILGGGVGAVTAACYLSEGNWRDRFESITLYQQGWRLGGKGASGRGVNSNRIEEHGLHIWFGFYENAFRMLHECHQELDEREQSGDPRWSTGGLRSVEQSFRRCSTVALTDHDGCDWKIWTADFPEDDDQPWLPRQTTWTVAAYVARTLDLAAAVAASLFGHERAARRGKGPYPPDAEISFVDAEREAQAALGAAPGVRSLQAAAELTAAAARPASIALLPALDVVLEIVDRVLDAARLRLDQLVRHDDLVRRSWYLLDLLLANVRGVVRDGVVEADDFDIVDDWDYRDWLRHHGAMRESVDCAFVRAVVYDLAFAYEDGDIARPRCGAGTALRGLARTFFGYRGALMYKMNAGMGDVVFAPLYELLVKRKVDVKFFRRVEKLHVSQGMVTGIDIDVQAVTRPGARPEDYVPELPRPVAGAAGAAAAGGGYRTWPSRPPGAVLPPRPAVVSGGAPPPDDSDVFESYWWSRQKSTSRHLHRSVRPSAAPPGPAADNAFDLVVFGLSIGSVPYVAGDLVAGSPRWSAAVTKVKTVATQALQLWLEVEPEQLGPDWTRDALAGGFVEPFDTWADMQPLVDEEGPSGAKSIAYFCNVMADPDPPLGRGDQAWVARHRQLVRKNAERFVARDLAVLWPGFLAPGGPRWEWLVDPDGRADEHRLDAQFWRANVEPSERYVLSVPGSSRYRIPPDDTGIQNLYAVGDWTACKLNAGCVEAAVMSGIRAANAINRAHGGPAVDVIGWDEP